jgi:serine phosphatase RsbU (regulator of sigma subunit)
MTYSATEPLITGALLSGMLNSMNELGGMGNLLLSKHGVDKIESDEWYPRELQHKCFSEIHKKLGSEALYSIGFSYQNIVRTRLSRAINDITSSLHESNLEKNTKTDKLEIALDSTSQLIDLLQSGVKNDTKNHAENYGFYFERHGRNCCRITFRSFSVSSITPYCQGIIYGLLRLSLPPQIQINIKLNTELPHRNKGDNSDTFDIQYQVIESSISFSEMVLSESLKVKQSLLLAAISSAEKAEAVAQSALAHHMDSVNYASRIQRGLLASDVVMNRRFTASGILWEPRDLIGGDIYWTTPGDDNDFSIALIDCSGHGVPGALLSMLVSSSLDRIYHIDPKIEPGVALSKCGDLIRSLLNQDVLAAESDDGFDGAICRINKSNNELFFSGARTNLYVVPSNSKSAVVRISGERRALGYSGIEPHAPIETCRLKINQGDMFLLVSDGVIDQVGHERGIAFGNKRLIDVLSRNRNKAPQAILDDVYESLAEWQGPELRRDDISACAFTL